MKKSPSKIQKGTLLQVLRYVGKYPFSLIFTVLFAAVTVAGNLLIPVLVGKAVDHIVGAGGVDFAALKRVFWQIFACAGTSAVTQWLVSVLNNRISLCVVRDLRRDAFAKISRLPLKYVDTHSHGDVVSRIVADADQFADGLLMGFTQFFTGLLTILGTIALMLLTNAWVALVVIFVTPLSLLTARFISTRIHSYFVAQSKARAEQTAFVEEMLPSLKTVQAFGYEQRAKQKFLDVENRLKKASLDATFFSSLVNPSTRFVNNVVYALVALIGALSIIGGGAFTVGNLTQFLAYANQYTKPFNEISGVVTELQNAIVCASRIFELLKQAEEPSDSHLATLEKVEGCVEMRGVSFSYLPEKPLIQNLNVKAAAGKRIAIVGPTGCGKTTLINLLMRFYDVDRGQVCVDGNDVQAVTRHSLRSAYGMVLQDTWLKCGTVRENIAMGRDGVTNEQIIAAAKAAHAHGFIKRLPNGYDTVLAEDGGNLSQGQKQLLCIARIMLVLPPMLILDEATSSIDTRTELKISDAFATLMQGRTSFIVAHRLSTIKSADLILVMNAGNVVEQGTHEQLLEQKGFYYKIYHSQFS